MAPRRDISSLNPGESVDEVYALQEANLLTSSKGSLYLRMTLADASGTITANMWDADEQVHARLRAGEAVRITGAVETYRGHPQVRVIAVRPAREQEYAPDAFVARSPADLDDLRRELGELVATVGDTDYRRLLSAFFEDTEFMREFARAPAAMRNHHAYVGGLLEHTTSICRLAAAVGRTWKPGLDLDLLLAGAMLHDVGKTRELSVRTCIQYSDIGGLLGHITIGVIMVQERARALALPPRKLWLVQHLILSHHGQREFGTPVLPCVPEAMVLHHLDNLDAKATVACRQIADDAGTERAWTDWSRMLETRLFKQDAAADGGLAEHLFAPAPADDDGGGGGGASDKRHRDRNDDGSRAASGPVPRTLFDEA